MANADGLEAQSDFEDAAAEFGVDMVRVRHGYTDIDGYFQQEHRTPTKALFVPSQPSQPYGIFDVGVDNIRDGNPVNIFLPFSNGKPKRSDVMLLDEDVFKITTVNPLPYGDVTVCWQCEMVRTGTEDSDG